MIKCELMYKSALRSRGLRWASSIAAIGLTTSLLGACSPSTDADGIIHVPEEVPTLTAAEELAQPGDVIIAAPGTYNEQVEVTTPDITIRGADRNDTIIDGEGIRPYGIVVTVDGVRVENLTVSNATFYGLLFTGLHDESGPQAPTASNYEPWDPEQFPPLQRFLADHVTASNNGLYGIYAFNSQHGAIINSYASGSADSGIYVGQCRDCDILVQDNVAERNAVGFENSNASDSLLVAGNRFSSNRVGLTLLSNYQESFVPQRDNIIVGNVIADNNESDSPAQADGGFGTGIGISGGVGNLIQRNLIAGNSRSGIILDNIEDLPSESNAFIENELTGNHLDVVNLSAERSPASANCFDPAAGLNTHPEALADTLVSEVCTAPTSQNGDVSAAQAAATSIPGPEAPRGVSYLSVAKPIMQPQLPPRNTYTRLSDRIVMPSADDFGLPEPSYLSERTGTL